MGKSRLPPKKDVALALLESSTVFVHLDPRADGVTVPPWFKKQPQLVLQIGLNMPVPIPDLSLDGDGVSCTLSFNRSPQFCNVPWKAIYALVGEDGRGMVWPDDVPPEVAAQTRVAGGEAKTKKKKKAHLRAVEPKVAAARGRTRQSAGDGAEGKRVALRRKEAARPRATETDGANGPARPLETRAARDTRSIDSRRVDTHDVERPDVEAESHGSPPPSSKKKLPPYLRVVK
jgi:stringent starvation protein B